MVDDKPIKSKSHQCFLAMGGNIGNVAQTFEVALRLLDESPGISLKQVSSFHKTLPMGDNAGTETSFLNAACEIETTFKPLQLLDELQNIETELGRERTLHWGPRTLDLDIILCGQQKINCPRLQVPHPACWYRRFVLDPLVEIAGDVLHPTKDATFHQLRERLLQQPFTVALTGGDKITRKQLLGTLKQEYPSILFEEWYSSRKQNDQEPTVLVWLEGNEIDFESLPTVPRIDLSQEDDPLQAFRNIICAATNE